MQQTAQHHVLYLQAMFKRDRTSSGAGTPSSTSTAEHHLDWSSFKTEDQTLIHQVSEAGTSVMDQ